MRGRWLGLAVGGMLLAPGGASAQALFDNHCVTGSFQACASVRVAQSGNKLTMQVWNLEGMISNEMQAITAVGLYHSNGPWLGRFSIDKATYVTPGGNTDITSYWQRKPNEIRQIGGINVELASGVMGLNGVVGCQVPTFGVYWSTCQSFPADPYVEIEFTVDQQFAMDNLAVRWRSIRLPDKAYVDCDSGGAGGNDCGPTPVAVVPEPVSSVLLLTGAAGMAGVRAVRRRRKGPESESTEEA